MAQAMEEQYMFGNFPHLRHSLQPLRTEHRQCGKEVSSGEEELLMTFLAVNGIDSNTKILSFL